MATRRANKIRRIFAAAFLAWSAAASAQASCGVASDAFTLDWNQGYAYWPAGQTQKSISVPSSTSSRSENVQFSFSGALDRLYYNSPQTSNLFNGGFGMYRNSLQWVVAYRHPSDTTTLTITFADPVESLSFSILDVDWLAAYRGRGGYADTVQVTGKNTTTGASVPAALSTPYFSPPTTNTYPSTVWIGSPYPSNEAVGYNGNSNNDNTGNLNLTFSQPVNQVTINYSDSANPPSSRPDPEGIGVYDLNFCVASPNRANVTTTKTERIFSETPKGCGTFPGTPDPKAAYAIPGACIEYKITATNSGNGDATGLAITDPLNPDLYFEAASLSGFSNGGTGYGLTAPSAGQDCAGGACTVKLSNAILPAGATGQILIRTIIK